MSRIFYVFTFLCLVQVALCRVTRDAPVEEKKPNLVTDLAREAGNAVGVLQNIFFNFVGVKDNEEFSNLVNNQSRAYSEQLRVLVAQLTDEAKANSGKFETAIKGISNKLQETAQDLETKNPEFFQEAKKYRENFQLQLSSVLDETQKFNDKIKSDGGEISEKVKEVLAKVLENTLDTAKTVTKQIEDKVNEKKE